MAQKQPAWARAGETGRIQVWLGVNPEADRAWSLSEASSVLSDSGPATPAGGLWATGAWGGRPEPMCSDAAWTGAGSATGLVQILFVISLEGAEMGFPWAASYRRADSQEGPPWIL